MRSFKDLLWMAKDGDEFAREEIFLMYKPLLVKNAVVDGCFCEDLFQELSKTLILCIVRFKVE